MIIRWQVSAVVRCAFSVHLPTRCIVWEVCHTIWRPSLYQERFRTRVALFLPLFFFNQGSHYEALTLAFPFSVCGIGCRWTWVWSTVGMRLTEENRGTLEWNPLRFFFAYRKSHINCPIILSAQQTKYLKFSKWIWSFKRTIILTFFALPW
jgi:hypothetical protein